MKTSLWALGLVLAVAFVNGPAYAVTEGSAGAAVKELTLADFMRSAGKPTQGWEQYRQYQFRLRQPTPQPTLAVSRMRREAAESAYLEGGTKPAVAFFKKMQPAKLLTPEPYIAPAVTSTGKPSLDWWKARQLRKG